MIAIYIVHILSHMCYIYKNCPPTPQSTIIQYQCPILVLKMQNDLKIRISAYMKHNYVTFRNVFIT